MQRQTKGTRDHEQYKHFIWYPLPVDSDSTHIHAQMSAFADGLAPTIAEQPQETAQTIRVVPFCMNRSGDLVFAIPYDKVAKKNTLFQHPVLKDDQSLNTAVTRTLPLSLRHESTKPLEYKNVIRVPHSRISDMATFAVYFGPRSKYPFVSPPREIRINWTSSSILEPKKYAVKDIHVLQQITDVFWDSIVANATMQDSKYGAPSPKFPTVKSLAVAIETYCEEQAIPINNKPLISFLKKCHRIQVRTSNDASHFFKQVRDVAKFLLRNKLNPGMFYQSKLLEIAKRKPAPKKQAQVKKPQQRPQPKAKPPAQVQTKEKKEKRSPSRQSKGAKKGKKQIHQSVSRPLSAGSVCT